MAKLINSTNYRGYTIAIFTTANGSRLWYEIMRDGIDIHTAFTITSAKEHIDRLLEED